MMNGQRGQALPLAILALAIGSLVLAPFLGYAGANLIGSRVYGEAIAQQSAGDAGIEHAIWSLTRGTLAEQFSQPGEEVTYQLDETLNGVTVSVTVTANATGGGISAGDISDMPIDTLEYDTSNGYETSIVHVSGDIYAIAYRGSGSDGFLKTISINASGQIGSSAIDTLEYDTSSGYEPSMIHVYGDIYAIAYRGSGNDGFLKTISINAGGQIGSSAIDTLEYDTSNGYESSIIYVSGDIYTIAYRGSGSDGFLKTISIGINGQIGNSAIDTLEYDRSNGYEPSIIHVYSDIYAIAYRGAGNDGFLKTVSINASGQIANSVIDTFEYDTSNGYEPSIINVSGDVYAIAYRGAADSGRLTTVSIDPGGNIDNSVIDDYTFDSYGCEPRIINVSDDMFAIAYRGPGNRGYLKTISIDAGGDIAGSVTDTFEYDAYSGYEPVIINASGNIYAIAYRGPSRDGFVRTVAIAGTGGTASYEIVATAGDRTIRALVDIDDSTASIISWQIE
jgi:hypothetical protein